MEPQPDQFESRHIGINNQEEAQMCEVIGVSSLGTLVDETVPHAIRMQGELKLPSSLTEFEYIAHIKELASKNKVNKSYIGRGYYNTIVPLPILRNLFENPGWYTQYTPYQAEISQGRLESLLNYQTMVSDLTGLPIVNASLLDEGTAAAEAMHMFYEAKNKREEIYKSFYIDHEVWDQTVDVVRTRLECLDLQLKRFNWRSEMPGDDAFGVLIQYPDAIGSVSDYTEFVTKLKENNIYVAVATDLMSLCILTPPGSWGADVALGNSQRFGVPMGFGGPHAAFFATKEEFKRAIPGRIIGVSQDINGKFALRMALQTREQHIKREKATSNICTAQALLANMAAMYAVYHGPDRLKSISYKIHKYTSLLASSLTSNGIEIVNTSWFDTLTIKSNGEIDQILKNGYKNGINLGSKDGNIQIALDETTSLKDLVDLLNLFDVQTNEDQLLDRLDRVVSPITSNLLRTSLFLEHEVFNTYHTESKIMRYLKRLENKDLSLVHSMISLGSCTMKLNAAAEMIPVSFPEFANIHPFAPRDQWTGYEEILNNLSQYLIEITGFSACSLQPNSGAQGEFAGLVAIKRYHDHHGQHHRNIALIPSSAHGTNPASAVMAGMKVIVIKTDEKGNVDFEDLKRLATEHSGQLSCLMVTYPSTFGVYEENIKEICQVIHDHGGLVYMDGANMNAQVGLTSPGLIGADVCHLNLHKTFAIPHGGGGPGMGPICCNEKLAPFLPGHVEFGTRHSLSAAPFGSASILLISYGYIRMLGKDGVRKATEAAILNANYLKARLERKFEILFSGSKGRAAHELIVDLRPFKNFVSAEDVAKRLIDYGFHAPTLSFPVAGTIMIEPTESEGKDELDRFSDALLSIFEEINEIADGQADPHNNVLVNAPHPLYLATADEWPFPYSREKALYPLSWVSTHGKFWVEVARVDNAFGDRNLVCTCPPIEAYQ